MNHPAVREADRVFMLSRDEAPFVFAAILPFIALWVVHYSGWGSLATGFFQADMAYYVANAREIFERGNGFAYSNPFDPSSTSPVIYFHWLLWPIGFAIKILGVDPGVAYLLFGLVASVMMSWLTFSLVRNVLPAPHYRRLLFLLAMWGGGLLSLSMVFGNLRQGESLTTDIAAMDPAYGFWMLTWGRNVVFPTEAAYHALAASCWLFVMRGQHWLAIAIGALIAATHPWTGIGVLLTLWGYWTARMLFDNRRNAVPYWLSSGLCMLVLLGYYLIFLNSFDAHRVIHDVWSQDWSLSWKIIVFAWAPVFAAAVIRCSIDRKDLGWNDCFLLIAFLVAFSLSIHDRFISPIQPAHFSRGYVWMPLFLLALPWLQRSLVTIRSWRNRSWAIVTIGLLFVMATFDNQVFLLRHGRLQSSASDEIGIMGPLVFRSAGERAWLRYADTQEWGGVVLTPDDRLGFLSAVYSNLAPYTGYLMLTPELAKRQAHVKAFYSDSASFQAIEWLNSVDFVVIPLDAEGALVAPVNDGWDEVFRNSALAVYKTAQGTTG